jgi:hypothetical protein
LSSALAADRTNSTATTPGTKVRPSFRNAHSSPELSPAIARYIRNSQGAPIRQRTSWLTNTTE